MQFDSRYGVCDRTLGKYPLIFYERARSGEFLRRHWILIPGNTENWGETGDLSNTSINLSSDVCLRWSESINRKGAIERRLTSPIWLVSNSGGKLTEHFYSSTVVKYNFEDIVLYLSKSMLCYFTLPFHQIVLFTPLHLSDNCSYFSVSD